MPIKQTRSTAVVVPQHFKIKESDIHLTENYCTTISIQKISPIHEFIVKIQKILASRELNGHGHF